MNKIFLATDLDRTILPNGNQPESSTALPTFRQLVVRPEIILAYVSGRSQRLQQEAIHEYQLPLPDYAIGDVGTTIYQVGTSENWQPITAWEEEIAIDWAGNNWSDIYALFKEVEGLRLQQDTPDQQNKFKVSFYTDKNINKEILLKTMQQKVAGTDLKLSFIFSIDELQQVGLLDVLPESATKLHAVQFLRNNLAISDEQTVFAGDSGNDIPVLTSGLKAIMVKNTRAEVQTEVKAIAQNKGIANRIYTAQGNWHGMNGNYSAGVLEGFFHFFP